MLIDKLISPTGIPEFVAVTRLRGGVLFDCQGEFPNRIRALGDGQED